MQKLLGYALAFGAGISTAKLLQWFPVANQHQHQHQHGEQTPGSKMTMKGRILDMGARMAGHFAPINSIHQHVCGFHFYSGELNRQLIAHHYCSHINQDVRQCVIYDSDRADARLIGIEYIISEKIFNQLPPEEKKLWHSHVYEVKSGELITPGVPDIAEKEVMKELINTYGKTFHTWQIDRGDTIPLGVPQLMMAFLQDGQINEDLVRQRDEYYKVSTEDKKRQRTDIEPPKDTHGADAWSKSGKAVQLTTSESKMKTTKWSLF
ncbi:unnamed protein product [Rotaria sordida]|uniref:DUF1264-domain-containing protein n=1 Tax=Rotaria sordida TaxID=392033 RepID=A0A814L0G2_9BILA|nr:unnamed protein product [Rotaria sordida]CAF3756509.1 unnamed protein product [Rotaria sordida]